MPRASIVIPLYGRSDLTEQCLRSLETAGDDVQLVLVDNASPDDTPDLLRRMATDALVIRNERNLGFATACNQGAVAAEADVVVFLNNDTEVADGWLDPLLDELEDPGVGGVGARLLYPTGRIQHAGMAMAPGGTPLHLHRGAPGGHPLVSGRRDFDLVTAACLAMRRETVAELGGFDTGYRNGFEDVDLCLRLRARGLRIRYAGDSVVVHHESQSPGRYDSELDNTLLFRARWRGWPADFGARVAEDTGLPGFRSDSLWAGPLFDGSSEARAGREAIVALSAEGGRPCAVEWPVRGEPVDDCPPEVLAALNRPFLSSADAISWGPSATDDAVSPRGIVIPDDVARDALAGGAPDATARRRTGVGPARPGIRWIAALAGRSGYAVASRNTIEAGRAAGVSFHLASLFGEPAHGIGSPADDAPVPPIAGAAVLHATPAPGVAEHVAAQTHGPFVHATCFETEGLPVEWVESLSWPEQVWVPSEFNMRTFAAAGVPAERLRHVPYPIDADRFAPPPERGTRTDDRFTVASVFEWNWRKGWDVLLRGWIEAFAPGDPVVLRVLTYRAVWNQHGAGLEEQIGALLGEIGCGPDEIPDIELITEPMSDRELTRLYHESDAFVLPTRGEGAGLPVLEAAAAGTPVIATARGGHEALMDEDLAFPLAVDRLLPAPEAMIRDNPIYAGQMFGEPSVAQLRDRLREVRADPAEAARRADRARDALRERFGYEAVGRILVERVDELLELGAGVPAAASVRA
jgi:GT2 family glycosyltransferase/glycosyltransferase involved in cell wall biosynthesis